MRASGFVIALAVLASGCAPPRSLPADAQLERNFRTSEADFRKLAAMSSQDARITRIANDFNRVFEGVGAPVRPATPAELPPARWDGYRELFKKLSLSSGLSRDAGCLLLPAAILQVGTVDSEEKGYAYCAERPSPLYPSLDKTPVPVSKPLPAFRELKDHWYLYWRYNE
ncbi:MAG TPA: hypothetical protein VM120_20845 [Bryobacteraceae bacterium]|nr:hypothetical protein [Bryobacteraceae bacterium]